MKLKKLLKEIPELHVKGSKDIEITGICANSRRVCPGNLFIAKKGINQDGNHYIPDAVNAGAAAILTDLYNPFLNGVTQLIYPNVSSIAGLLSSAYYDHPSRSVFTVGITGTNGKTTVSYLIKHLLDAKRGPTGLIGTIEYHVGEQRYQAIHTTPDVETNHKLLFEMLRSSCRSAVMEVSSHALEQGRVDAIHYDTAIFTNLSPEHLDYHGTMDAYAKAKKRLFDGLQETAIAIVNADSPYSDYMISNCSAACLTFGLDSRADVQAINPQFLKGKIDFTLAFQSSTYPFSVPFVGRYNLSNILSAIALGLSIGMPMEQIAAIFSHAPQIPGRMERIENALGIELVVDFAHTEDALVNAMSCLKEASGGRLITVFGCGGERDATKRPKMGSAAESYSDCVVVTSDNPRAEDPSTIASQVVSGMKKKSSVIIETDRRLAIQKAIEIADPGDTVLIAGKGHETTQIFAHQTLEFDDRAIARSICEKLIKAEVN